MTMPAIYDNLHKFALEYRKYTLISERMDAAAFKKQLQYDRYVKMDVMSKNNEKISIVILDEGSKYSKTVSDLRILITHLVKSEKNITTIILVSKEDLKAQIAKILPKLPGLHIYNYFYYHFIIEIPKAIFCPKHEIINKAEHDLLKANYIDIVSTNNNLPRIFEDDPQCIWIGAKAGDIVRITRNSNNVGESIEYRKVVQRGFTHVEQA